MNRDEKARRSVTATGRFAARTAWASEETAWSRALTERRRRGLPILDLTASNPTQCGFGYDPHLLRDLAAEGARYYEPDPRGMLTAREAVCAYYADHEVELDPARIVLTTSTSEGYSRLFRLLCDPGDEVLIAQPSYPLFDLLATIDDVALRAYPLLYDPTGDPGSLNPGSRPAGGGTTSQVWSLDLHTLRQRITARTRAVIVVHPNNPTGHYTTQAERDALVALCAEHGLALIVDEVFLDYAFAGYESPVQSFAAGEQDVLTFVLSGLSKVAALPQMKASWIVCLGPDATRWEAMRRLEIIADTFLSMNAPVQHALPGWLHARQSIQQQIRARVEQNLAGLDGMFQGQHSVSRIAGDGGWYATLRIPPFVKDEVAAIQLLEEYGVAVHPGGFFGFREPNRLVVSLLPDQQTFAEGVAAICAAQRLTGAKDEP